MIAEGLGTDIYFAHPYASWERGINENTNGLIWRYFPKGTDFSEVTEEQVEHAMDRSTIDHEPREVVGHSMNYLWGSERTCLLRN